MNNPATKELTEAEVRRLRDRVYCIPITDTEWKVAGAHWMSPEGIAFLRAHDFPISESLKRSETAPAKRC